MNHFGERKLDYDKTDQYSIEKYSQKLIGKTFKDVLFADNPAVEEPSSGYDSLPDSVNHAVPGARLGISKKTFLYIESISNSNYKGSMGNLIEEHFFHYAINSDSDPDFPDAGVELKVTPYKINNNGEKAAKERLIITMIDYNKVISESFETSHLWNKSRCILLIFYLFQKDTKKLDYRIDYSKLFTPPAEDLKIIKHDFETIANKIREGKANELSESDTLYLGACTKSATSANRRKQPNSNLLAKPRAFAFKNSYMTYVLNHYIIPSSPEYEKIIDNSSSTPFENQVIQRINKYIDETEQQLCQNFDISYQKKPKNLDATLIYRMLGIKGNNAEEFLKAGIKVKSIRVGMNGKIKENMSFPTFKFTDIIKEDWETSTFRTYLEETRFFFVVYATDENSQLYLKGSMFWNIPYNDLEGPVKETWMRTKSAIANGLHIQQINGKYSSNLPKQSENPICHVRPHGRDSKDTCELPDGRHFPKQCFWLNNSYILQQINKSLK